MATTAFGETQIAELTPAAGWTFAYNVNADLVTTTTTGTGAVTADTGRAKLSTSAAINSSAKIETKLPVRYVPGQGVAARFTAVFTTPQAGSTQIIGLGDANDGLFFGFNGTSFGILRRVGGSDNWTTADEWSSAYGMVKDDADTPTSITDGVTTLDLTKGNIFQIQFQWLGYGEIRFFVEEPTVGGFVCVHKIRFASTSATTHLRNPTFPVMAQVANTTNDTDIVLYTPSAMAFIEGKVENPPAPNPLALSRTLTAADTTITTEHNLLTVKNLATWQSLTNRIRARMRRLSVGVDGTKNVTIRITKDTTLAGTPSYSDYSANASPVQYDTAGTTLTGGTVVFAATLQKIDSAEYDLDAWNIVCAPGETLTVSAASSAGVDVDIALNWVELL